MKLDKEMDHGPILIQSMLDINNNDTSHTVEIKSGQAGGELLSQIFESYTSGHLIAKEQDHSIATFCKFVNKADGEVSLKDDVEIVKNKFRAYTPWPGIFFMHMHNENNIRVKISAINFEAEDIDTIIQKVIPEGKSEMTFESFKNGYIIN
jgi:methionyl-tRNA formyltransferase